MIDLPVKRSEGETFEERLTHDAYHWILPARYLQRDASGEVVETPEQMFRRGADNVARPDAEYGNDSSKLADLFYEMMTTACLHAQLSHADECWRRVSATGSLLRRHAR